MAYTKIDELIWSDQKYCLLSDDGKLLFMYVMSCRHRNIIGLYYLPIAYGAFDLNWDVKRFSKGLLELSKNGLIKHKEDSNIIMIVNFLKYNPLENPNQVKGAVKALAVLPPNGLDSTFLNSIKTLNKPFMKPLIELLEERLLKPVDVYVDVTEDETVTENEDESEDEEIKNICVFDYWQSKKIHIHKELSIAIKKQIEKLSKKQSEEVIEAIDNYSTAYFDPSYFYKNRWTLDNFIKQKNGYADWLEEGKNWVMYKGSGGNAKGATSTTIGNKPANTRKLEEWELQQIELTKRLKSEGKLDIEEVDF